MTGLSPGTLYQFRLVRRESEAGEEAVVGPETAVICTLTTALDEQKQRSREEGRLEAEGALREQLAQSYARVAEASARATASEEKTLVALEEVTVLTDKVTSANARVTQLEGEAVTLKALLVKLQDGCDRLGVECVKLRDECATLRDELAKEAAARTNLLSSVEDTKSRAKEKEAAMSRRILELECVSALPLARCHLWSGFACCSGR